MIEYDTRLENYYSTTDIDDFNQHRMQFDSVKQFYKSKGYDVDFRHWTEEKYDTTYYRMHLVVYEWDWVAGRGKSD